MHGSFWQSDPRRNLRQVAAVLPVDDAEAWTLLQRAARVPSSAAEGSHVSLSGPRTSCTFESNAEPSRNNVRQPDPSDAPGFLQHLGDRTGQALLEEVCLDRLSAVAHEERRNLTQLQAGLAEDAMRSSEQSKLHFAEAELNYLTRFPERQRAVDFDDLQTLLAQLSVLPCPEQDYDFAGTQAPHAGQVASLLGSCECFAEVRDVLPVARSLGDTLLELDRECHAMFVALSTEKNATCDRSKEWPRRLASTALALASGLELPPPPVESLANQLEMENDLLRDAMQRARDTVCNGDAFS